MSARLGVPAGGDVPHCQQPLRNARFRFDWNTWANQFFNDLRVFVGATLAFVLVALSIQLPAFDRLDLRVHRRLLDAIGSRAYRDLAAITFNAGRHPSFGHYLPLIAIVVSAFGAYFFMRRRARSGLILLLAVLGSYTLVLLLKRVLPDPHVPTAWLGGHAFPSFYSTVGLTLYPVLVFLITRTLPAWWRWPVVGVGGIFAAATVSSALAIDTPSQVLAGSAVSLAWLAALQPMVTSLLAHEDVQSQAAAPSLLRRIDTRPQLRGGHAATLRDAIRTTKEMGLIRRVKGACQLPPHGARSGVSAEKTPAKTRFRSGKLRPAPGTDQLVQGVTTVGSSAKRTPKAITATEGSRRRAKKSTEAPGKRASANGRPSIRSAGQKAATKRNGGGAQAGRLPRLHVLHPTMPAVRLPAVLTTAGKRLNPSTPAKATRSAATSAARDRRDAPAPAPAIRSGTVTVARMWRGLTGRAAPRSAPENRRHFVLRHGPKPPSDEELREMQSRLDAWTRRHDRRSTKSRDA